MPPRVALFLCLAFILYSLWKDNKGSHGISHSLWIPFIWLAISASKPITYWLYPRFSPHLLDSADYIPMAGNALERNPLIVLMVLGLIILYQRRNLFSIDFMKNSYIWLLFFYMFLSIGWTDNPGASLIKWFRAIGDVIMILVILTEDDPEEATVRLLRRLAIVLIPLSVLFVRYFRYIGVIYDRHLGTAMYVGVTRHKNTLGQLCIFVGIFLLWRMIRAKPKIEILDVILILLTLYLFQLANSITSIAAFVVGSVILFFVGLFHFDLNRAGRIVISGILLLVIFEVLLIGFAYYSLSSHFFMLMGREASLTGRIPLWQDIIRSRAPAPNP